MVSCDHFTVTHTRGEIFDCYRKVGLTDEEFTHLGQFYADLNQLPETLDEDEVDWQYLREFDQKYCRRFSLLELAAMDPLLTGDFHHRDIYYRPANRALFFKALELKAKWLEEIFRDRRFDVIFSENFQYFVKAAVYTMSKAMNVPFLVASGCRIADLYLIFDNFTMGTPLYVVEEMKRLEAAADDCADALGYTERLRAERKPAYVGFELTLKSIASQMPLAARLRHLLWMVTRYPKTALFVNKHYRGLFRRNYFLPNYFPTVKAEIVGLWRRLSYFRHKQLVSRRLPTAPFVFFPLHLIPENSVLTLSKTFNEFECIFQLSKVLPPDWKIVVKINPNMLTSYDTHPNRYYLAMSSLPNVQFVHPSTSSGEIIERSRAVAAISGTALLEGAIYGKPGFRWGRTEFEAVDLIVEFDPNTVRDHLGKAASKNLNYYIQACFNLGFRLDMRVIGHSLATQLSPTQEEDCRRQLDELEKRIYQFRETYSAD